MAHQSQDIVIPRWFVRINTLASGLIVALLVSAVTLGWNLRLDVQLLKSASQRMGTDISEINVRHERQTDTYESRLDEIVSRLVKLETLCDVMIKERTAQQKEP